MSKDILFHRVLMSPGIPRKQKPQITRISRHGAFNFGSTIFCTSLDDLTLSCSPSSIPALASCKFTDGDRPAALKTMDVSCSILVLGRGRRNLEPISKGYPVLSALNCWSLRPEQEDGRDRQRRQTSHKCSPPANAICPDRLSYSHPPSPRLQTTGTYTVSSNNQDAHYAQPH